MNKEEKAIVEELLKSAKLDSETEKDFRMRLLQASQGNSTNKVVVSTEDMKIIEVLFSPSAYILKYGLPKHIKTETTFVDSLKERRCYDGERLIHFEKDFKKGLYSSPKHLKIRFDFEPFEDGKSLKCKKTGVIIDKSSLHFIKGKRVKIENRPKNTTSYVHIIEGGKHTPLHRIIMNPAKYECVDHINHNGLDNRVSNLRCCPQSYNTLNRRANNPKKYTKSSKYMGVSKSSKKKAFGLDTKVLKQRFRGSYYDEVKAAKLYDIIQICLCKEYACTNFPIESYDKQLLQKFKNIYLKNYKSV